MKLACTFLVAFSAFAADMDSTRGAALFESQGCVNCHSIGGRGGHVAPDLGSVVDRSYTPAALAGTMWNHAPTMWTAIRSMGSSPPALEEQSAADLFAFFYAARFFEQPGDASRGKAVFTSRGCAKCHAVGPQQPYPRADGIRLAIQCRWPRPCGITLLKWRRKRHDRRLTGRN
jgi:cytochrome c2